MKSRSEEGRIKNRRDENSIFCLLNCYGEHWIVCVGGARGGVVMEGMGRATGSVLEGCFTFAPKKCNKGNLTSKKEILKK